MRNVFWACEDEFRKNVLKTQSLRFPFHSPVSCTVKINPGTKYVNDLQYRLFVPRKETLTLPRCQHASRFSRGFICLFLFCQVLFSFRPQYPIEEASMVLTVELFFFYIFNTSIRCISFSFFHWPRAHRVTSK